MLDPKKKPATKPTRKPKLSREERIRRLVPSPLRERMLAALKSPPTKSPARVMTPKQALVQGTVAPFAGAIAAQRVTMPERPAPSQRQPTQRPAAGPPWGASGSGRNPDDR